MRRKDKDKRSELDILQDLRDQSTPGLDEYVKAQMKIDDYFFKNPSRQKKKKKKRIVKNPDDLWW